MNQQFIQPVSLVSMIYIVFDSKDGERVTSLRRRNDLVWMTSLFNSPDV